VNTILLVDDDLKLRFALSQHLSNAGYAVSTANSIGQMQTLLLHDRPDLIVLDRHLPDGNGFDACRNLRASHFHIPVIMLTASVEDAEIIEGLNCGADDYITKPFIPLELLARINAVIRRFTVFSNSTDHLLSKDITRGNFRYTASTRTVWYKQSIVPLSTEELVIFITLLEHEGNTVSRLTLSQELAHLGRSVVPRNIDMLIHRLRHKLSSTVSESNRIITIRGKGYQLHSLQKEHDA
jgi:DNA-binding response OmpR family regulator